MKAYEQDARRPAYVITEWVNPQLRALEPDLPLALSEVATRAEAEADRPAAEAGKEAAAEAEAEAELEL